jgi:hypothetical protein
MSFDGSLSRQGKDSVHIVVGMFCSRAIQEQYINVA